jgi:hypothetical protein
MPTVSLVRAHYSILLWIQICSLRPIPNPPWAASPEVQLLSLSTFFRKASLSFLLVTSHSNGDRTRDRKPRIGLQGAEQEGKGQHTQLQHVAVHVDLP